MKTILKTRQRGMSVVVVVMLSSVAAAVVFSALNTTLTQSRMSGNFQKAINAEYMADKAIYYSYHKLNALLKSNPTVSDQELAAIALQDKLLSSTNRQYASKAAILDVGLLDLTTDGYFYHDSQSKSRVLLRRFNGGSGSNNGNDNGGALFSGGLIGCEGVDLSGSGIISSYNSVDPSAVAGTVLAQTVKPGSTVTVSGGSPIQGDVLSTGAISMQGSGIVNGRVHAQGDITLNSGSGTINGAVWSQKNIFVQNTLTVKGELKANSNISISNGAKLLGGISTLGNLSVTNGPDVQGDTWVKGNISIVQWVANGNYFKNKNRVFYGGTTEHNFGQRSANINITPVPPIPDEWQDIAASSASNVCDPLDIRSEVQALKQLSPSNVATLNIRDAGSSGQKYKFTPTQAFTGSNLAPAAYQPVSSSFYGSNKKIYFFKNFSVAGSPPNNGLVIDEGDVTIFIDGDFVMEGSPRIDIRAGSTLTLILSGRAFFDQGEITTPLPKININGTPVFSVYSSYSSTQNCQPWSNRWSPDGCGIIVGNGFKEVYGILYSPLAPVLINSSATFSGAIIGKSITGAGSGQIKYDSALTKANIGGDTGTPEPAGTPRVTFSGWG